MGKSLMGLGVLLMLIGAFLTFAGHFPQLPWLGRLPGDIALQRKNFSFYFPLTSCLLISGLLSILFWLFSNFWRR